MAAAESTELKRFGLTAGLTNYSAAYATGLLLARRLLKKVGLDKTFEPNKEVNGEYYNVDDESKDRRPFKALLDVGITATTTGARVFAVLKGACDGGINVPHKTKRFPGYTKQKAEAVTGKRGKATEVEKTAAKFDASVLRGRIFGNHVSNYANKLKKDDPNKYKRQFSQWEKCLTDLKAKTHEEVYKKVFSSIIANPDRVKKEGNKKPTRTVVQQDKDKDNKPINSLRVLQNSKGKKWIVRRRLTNEQRKARVSRKFQECMAAQQRK